MHRAFKKGIFLLSAIITCLPAHKLCAQRSSADRTRDRNAAYEVKLMNEFMERFNNDSNTALRAYLDRPPRNPKKFDRRDMIATLFDTSKGLNNKAITQTFLAHVLDSADPKGLRFLDSNWFAEVKAIFEWNKRNAEIYLTLQIATGADGSSKWIIAGIRDANILGNDNPKKTVVKYEPGNEAQSFPPTEYATNFLMLHDVFVRSINPSTYFSPQLLNAEHGKKFILNIRNGNLRFIYASVTAFHSFQIPGYELKVEKVVRPTTNSGWLITDIQSFPVAELPARKEKLLRRTL